MLYAHQILGKTFCTRFDEFSENFQTGADPPSLVNCPTRWSLLFIFGFLCWSSSWWWRPHIDWCKLLGPLLRAGMAVLDQFFCKMYFLYVSRSRQKNLGNFFWVLPLQRRRFFQLGVKCQNCGANVRIVVQRGNCNRIISNDQWSSVDYAMSELWCKCRNCGAKRNL